MINDTIEEKLRKKNIDVCLSDKTHTLTLSHYRIGSHFEQLFVILVVVTPADGSVMHGQQILVMFMRRVSTDRVKQVMHSFH